MAATLGPPLWLYLMTRDTSRFACYNPGQYALNLNHENDRMCLVFYALSRYVIVAIRSLGYTTRYKKQFEISAME